MIPREFIIFVESRTNFIQNQEERDMRRFAFLATIITNTSGNVKRRYKISDFLPAKKVSGSDMFKMIKQINAVLGGNIERK